MFRHFIAVLIFMCCATTMAQDCTLSLTGTVIDYHDNKPLASADVYVVESGKNYKTNADGLFKITGLCVGAYAIVISHIDCDTQRFIVDLNKDLKKEFTLEHHINEIEAVTVVTDVHENDKTSQAITRVTSKTLEDYSGASLGDALATVTGVSTLKTGSSVVKPVVQGVHSSRVAIVNNGVRQQDQEWGNEHAPAIDVNAAASIRVLKGAAALRYGGDAVGGTIIINNERVIAVDTLKGKVILNGQSNGRGGSVSVRLGNYKKSGWFQSGGLSYKRLGDAESPDYVLSNTGSQTIGLNFKIGFQKFERGLTLDYNFYDTEIGILRASHIGNAGDLAQAINSGDPLVINDFTYDIDSPKQEVSHHAIHLNGYRRFKGAGKLALDYSFQFNNREEFDVRRGVASDKAALDLDLFTQTLAFHYTNDAADEFTYEAGIDGMYQVNKALNTGVRRLIPNFQQVRMGGFMAGNYKLNDKWLLDAGLRFDFQQIDAKKFYRISRWEQLGYDELFPQFEGRIDGTQLLTNPVLDYNLFAFTAGAKYSYNKSDFLSVNLSTANRAPNPSELFSDGLHHALATIELGELQLNKEQSYKLNTQWHMSKDKLDIDISPYYSVINDFIQLVPNGIETTIRGAFPVYQYEQIDAQLLGVDLSVSYDFYTSVNVPQDENSSEIVYDLRKLISLSSDFAYVNGIDINTDESLIDMPPVTWNTRAKWYIDRDSKFSLMLQNTTVFKQNDFPNNDFTVTVPEANGVQQDVVVAISNSPATYSLWNLGVGYAFNNATLRLSVDNLLNTNYRDYLNRQRYYADDTGRNLKIQLNYAF